MALWQFQCNIIPSRENVDKLSCKEIISWRDTSQPVINIDFLKREKGWSTNIIQYGKTEETCIEFVYVKNKLEEIDCRLDLRTLTKHKLIQIVQYVQNIGACFLVDNKIYPPELEIMIAVMKKSRASRYCKKPLKYFESMN